MSKSEIIINELQARITELEAINAELEAKMGPKKAAKGPLRRLEVLNILKEQGPISVQAIAEQLGISSANVSSQLSYLRKDYLIFTNEKFEKFIANPEVFNSPKPVESAETNVEVEFLEPETDVK